MTPKQHSFLAAYAECGIIADAARAAGIGRRSHYDWLQNDASGEYKQAFEDAEEEAIERMESECRRRAVEGTREPVIYQGKLCYTPMIDDSGAVVRDAEGNPLAVPLTVPRKSDNLLMFVLKAKRPDKYRDNATVEHTGTGGGPMALEVIFIDPKRKEQQSFEKVA
jgi:hypothetical protein